MRVLCQISLVCFLLARSIRAQSLPVVDLGYGLYQATTYNATGQYYTFSNIRYGAAPTGDLRFRAPQLPPTNRTSVDNGTTARICPQSIPQWALEGLSFVSNYTAGEPFNASAYVSPIDVTTLPQDPTATEDCLFLDVVVPQSVFNSTNSTQSKAPVLFWIHGGGYTVGNKAEYGVPGEIQSPDNTVIFVSINYRLGAFGFLAGPTLQTDGVSNAGFLDQRFALEWVQTHISSFGGDPNQVTVIGESAGAGSILHQITAYGGSNGSAPFQRAIPQSPAFFPYQTQAQQEQTFQGFLSYLNVTTIAEARLLPYSALETANIDQVAVSPYGTFTYTPVVDGSFVPDYPGRLLLDGRFDSSVSLMVGHNSLEGALFTDPAITNDSSFDSFIREIFPEFNDTLVAYVEDVLYPPPNSTSLYTDDLDRAILFNGEIAIVCNAFYLDTAFGNNTYAYIFDVPHGFGIHGDDTAYTFYTGPFAANYSTSTLNTTVANVMQDWILSFTKTGVPTTNVPGVPEFTTYGPNAEAIDLSQLSIGYVVDPAANARCKWWEQGVGFHN